MKTKIHPKPSDNQVIHSHLIPLIEWLVKNGHEIANDGKPQDQRSYLEITFTKLFDVELILENFILPDSIQINKHQINDNANSIFMTTTSNRVELAFSGISEEEMERFFPIKHLQEEIERK